MKRRASEWIIAAMVARRLGVFLAAFALLMSACAPNQTPAPSTEPGPSATPGPIAQATSPPAPSEEPPETTTQPTSVDLIRADVATGKLDEGTSYLYRFYAQWFDPRLPKEYQGVAEEDADLPLLAALAYPTLPPEDQARLRPFIVRPTHPESYFNDHGATAGRSSTARGPALAATAANDARCVKHHNEFFHREDLPTIPVTVWTRCLDVGGSFAYTLEDETNDLVRYVEDLWPKEIALMGPPIPDEFPDPANHADEVDEAGDGRTDIYVVQEKYNPYLRLLEREGTSVTYPASPDRNGGTSGYIVYDPYKAGSNDDERKAVVAHELFHLLELKYIAYGRFSCAYPNVHVPCRWGTSKSHWFSEASAAWAEHYFVRTPAGRKPDYDRFEAFLTTRLSLMDTAGTNAYRSWIWPLFMQQETGSANSIANTWRSMVGKDGWTAVQQVVSASLPFETHFRDFAVRVLNVDLDGDPEPIVRFHAIDPDFPDTTPYDENRLTEVMRNNRQTGDPSPRFGGFIFLPVTRNTVSVTESGIPELWAEYYDISPDSQVRSITFVFSGLAPQPQLDVDMLLRIDDKWERRKYGGGTIQFCLDKPADAAQQIILVLSNHEMQPERPIRGTWTVSPSISGCLTASDTLTYTSTYVDGTPDADYYRIVEEALTIRVSLGVGADGGALANDASTYRASMEVHETIKGLPGCDLVSEASGSDGGPFPDDGINGGLAQLPDGTWIMSIAAGVDIETVGSSGNCGGSSAHEGTHHIELPECDGTEIVGSSPRTFNFNCGQTGGWTWSITGKVTLGF